VLLRQYFDEYRWSQHQQIDIQSNQTFKTTIGPLEAANINEGK